ncbi:unnamed protein product, partial [Amoebophrya sp. A120]|eukprot:GSA120T00025800001.1
MKTQQVSDMFGVHRNWKTRLLYHHLQLGCRKPTIDCNHPSWRSRGARTTSIARRQAVYLLDTTTTTPGGIASFGKERVRIVHFLNARRRTNSIHTAKTSSAQASVPSSGRTSASSCQLLPRKIRQRTTGRKARSLDVVNIQPTHGSRRLHGVVQVLQDVGVLRRHQKRPSSLSKYSTDKGGHSEQDNKNARTSTALLAATRAIGTTPPRSRVSFETEAAAADVARKERCGDVEPCQGLRRLSLLLRSRPTSASSSEGSSSSTRPSRTSSQRRDVTRNYSSERSSSSSSTSIHHKKPGGSEEEPGKMKKTNSNGSDAMERITFLGAGCNLGLACLKGLLGAMTHSSSLMADAAHSLSDLVTDGATLLTIRLVQRPADAAHPYGYMRYEHIGTLGVSAGICAAGIGIGWEALRDLLAHQQQMSSLGTTTKTVLMGSSTTGTTTEINAVAETAAEHLQTDLPCSLAPENAPLAMVAILLSFLAKEMLYRRTLRIGEQFSSPVLIANAWHHRSDALSSVVAGFGIAGAWFDYPLCDPLGGVLVAGMVLRQGAELLEEAVYALADRNALSDELRAKLTALAKAASKDVLGVGDDLKVRKAGSKLFVDVTLTVSDRLTLSGFQQVAHLVRTRVQQEIPEVVDVDCDYQLFQHHAGGDGRTRSKMGEGSASPRTTSMELLDHQGYKSQAFDNCEEVGRGPASSSSPLVEGGSNYLVGEQAMPQERGHDDRPPDAGSRRTTVGAAVPSSLSAAGTETPTATATSPPPAASVAELEDRLRSLLGHAHPGIEIGQISVHFVPPIGSNRVAVELTILPDPEAHNRLGDLKLLAAEMRDLVTTETQRCSDCLCSEVTKVEVRLDLADGCQLIANHLQSVDPLKSLNSTRMNILQKRAGRAIAGRFLKTEMKPKLSSTMEKKIVG